MTDRDEQDEVERARALILQRRNRFLAAAIAGLGAASSGCAGNGRGPTVCLSVPAPRSGGMSGTAATGGAGSGGTGGSAGSKPQVDEDAGIDDGSQGG